jgi:hypothetical protein
MADIEPGNANDRKMATSSDERAARYIKRSQIIGLAIIVMGMIVKGVIAQSLVVGLDFGNPNGITLLGWALCVTGYLCGLGYRIFAIRNPRYTNTAVGIAACVALSPLVLAAALFMIMSFQTYGRLDVQSIGVIGVACAICLLSFI